LFLLDVTMYVSLLLKYFICVILRNLLVYVHSPAPVINSCIVNNASYKKASTSLARVVVCYFPVGIQIFTYVLCAILLTFLSLLVLIKASNRHAQISPSEHRVPDFPVSVERVVFAVTYAALTARWVWDSTAVYPASEIISKFLLIPFPFLLKSIFQIHVLFNPIQGN
jgi:hypothetical protein